MLFLRFRLICLSLLCVMAVWQMGCTKVEDETPDEEPVRSQSKDLTPTPKQVAQGGGGPAVGGILSTINKPKVQNDLTQIGKFYNLFYLTNSRSPKTEKELADYIKPQSAALYREIVEEKSYVVVPKSSLKASSILAYHKQKDRAGNQFVVRGDGAVKTMSADQLKAKLKK